MDVYHTMYVKQLGRSDRQEYEKKLWNYTPRRSEVVLPFLAFPDAMDK